MKNVFKIALALMLVMTAFSCKQDETSEIGDNSGELVIDFTNQSGAPLSKGGPAARDGFGQDKTEYPECDDSAVASKVYIKLANGSEYTIKLTSLDTQTEVLKLTEGSYTMTEFVVKDASDVVLYAMPLAGSKAATDNPHLTTLPYDFDIVPFTKKKCEVDVLCYVPGSYELFGYKWFQYTVYKEYSLYFFGDICTKFFEEWHETEPYSGQTTNDGYDFAAIFDVTITNATTGATYTESNLSFFGEGAPLCIKYLDNPDVDEDISYEIFLHMPDGTLESIHTADIPDGIYSEEGNAAGFGGADGVFDFAVGSCNTTPGQNDISLQLPAWLPLPETAKFKLTGSAYANGYRNVEVGVDAGSTQLASLNDAANPINFAGWCLAKHDNIGVGVWYDATVHSLLDIPGLPAVYNSAAAINGLKAIQWLINQPAGTYSPQHIQAAIWYILDGYGSANGAATTALANVSFVPKVGDYALVILDPIEAEGKKDIQMFGVRVDP